MSPTAIDDTRRQSRLDDLCIASTPLDAGEAAALEARAAAGASVLVGVRPGDDIAARLGGVEITGRERTGEWFVTLAPGPETARLDSEVAVSTVLTTLAPAVPGARVAATTSVRFDHRPALVVREVGRGRIVATGVDVAALLTHPTLGTLTRRLLSPSPPVRAEVGVAVVGYGPHGGMGYLHGLACTETEGLRLAAAVDPAAERLVAARADFGAEVAAYADAGALARDDDVEVAIVATPPVHHASLALELLSAGKHVVVEKPMCLRAADADAMIAVAAANDRTLTVHQSRRFDTDWLALRRVVTAGTIGEVFNVETFVGSFEHPCRAWHSEESISGGAVYDWGSHHLDWILDLMGSPPERVVCSSHTRVWHDTTNADQLTVWMRWADGREATFRQSDVAAIRHPKFYVQGTRGTLAGHYRTLRDEQVVTGRGYVGGWSHHAEAPVDLTVACYDGEHGLVESRVGPAPHPGWAFHRNLADHLLLGEPLAIDPARSRDVVAVLEAAHRSGAEGATVVEPSIRS